MHAAHPDPAVEHTAEAAVPQLVLRARAYLSMLARGPAPSLAAFVDQYGPLEAVERLRGGGITTEVHDELRTHGRAHMLGVEHAEHLLADADRVGMRLLTPEHTTEWPAHQLRCLVSTTESGQLSDHRPLALWVRGTLPLHELLGRRAVAVLGACACSSYGAHIAAEFAYQMGQAATTIASGGAYGIDAAATRGALTTDAPVLVVLANGADVMYPSGHQDLFSRVLQQGALVSEYVPGVPPGRSTFATRARLLSALTATTVIVEAGRRSGSLRAAETARHQGRPVFAVPGPVTSTTSVGTLNLIGEGHARLAATAADVLTALPAPPATADTGTPSDDQTR